MSMWPTKFDYERASSVDDAISKLGGAAKLLAGGHSLIPALKLRLAQPDKLVDIGQIEDLKGIEVNGSLAIGAMTTHAEIAASADVQSMCAPLAFACGRVGDPQVRNFGTLGGNIAHADPASDPPTVLVACDAKIHIANANGSREVSAGDFFVDLFTTDLGESELITHVEIPDLSGYKASYAKLTHPASRYALVGVCVVLDMNGNHCNSASVAVGGATVNAVRCSGAEAALAGNALNDHTLDAAVAALASDINDRLLGDSIYPEHYRGAMAGVYLRRAIEEATR
jgi:carbon-monoxide dehydrogenase medium subunit